jgi:branched-chain amino acid transport system ATP-binding protein
MTAEAQVLQAFGLCVHFGGVKAVDGVDISVARGETVGLIGPNGAGKTTTLDALTGFTRPTAGRVEIGGRDVTGWPAVRLAARRVARTFQNVRLFDGLTVLENVTLGAMAAGRRRQAARLRAKEVLVNMDLEHLAEAPAGAVAHGDERRIGIARAVASDPSFLMLDEPAAGLDDAETAALSRALEDARAQLGCGVLLVEHDMAAVMRLCQRLHVLNFGQTLAVGPTEVVRDDPAVMRAYFGDRAVTTGGADA